jgi:hypothetical protein
MGKGNAYRVFLGNPEGKGPKVRREDNIKTGVKEIGCEDVEWISLAQDRQKRRIVFNTIVNFRVC